jgi:spermidine synthase
MPWTEIAKTDAGGYDLALYVGEGGAYMIRAGGLELMNGREHRSEDLLGEIAATLAPGPSPRILLGGLGLGHTLTALAGALKGKGRITVAEISADVIAWYERYFEPALFARRPAGLRILHADVASLLCSGRRYDAIVLDVDNGPQALVAPSNGWLYGEEGLSGLRASLSANGILLLWSGFEDAGFAARATGAGFKVDRQSIPLAAGRAELCHFIYFLKRA